MTSRLIMGHVEQSRRQDQHFLLKVRRAASSQLQHLTEQKPAGWASQSCCAEKNSDIHHHRHSWRAEIWQLQPVCRNMMPQWAHTEVMPSITAEVSCERNVFFTATTSFTKMIQISSQSDPLSRLLSKFLMSGRLSLISARIRRVSCAWHWHHARSLPKSFTKYASFWSVKDGQSSGLQRTCMFKGGKVLKCWCHSCLLSHRNLIFFACLNSVKTQQIELSLDLMPVELWAKHGAFFLCLSDSCNVVICDDVTLLTEGRKNTGTSFTKGKELMQSHNSLQQQHLNQRNI